MAFSKKEIKRQTAHVLGGLFFAIGIYLDYFTPIALFSALLLIILIFSLSRKYKWPFFKWYFKNFERKQDQKHFPGRGMLFYFLGALVAVLLFEKKIAIASMLILGFGDAVSPFIGIKYGKIKHPFSSSKFIEGHIVGAIIAGLAAMFFVPWQHAFIASFAAMFVEGIDVSLTHDTLNDNLVIPVIAGLVLTLLA